MTNQSLADIANRHGISEAGAQAALDALKRGNGSQAQFNHPDLGGMGQWSRGGMMMIGDMFNTALKAKVGALFADLEPLAQQRQADETRSDDQPVRPGTTARGSRWPADLGTPSSTGSQNDMHYAVFPDTHRLAVERDGQMTVYDTGDHRISGAGQQQGGTQTLRFSTTNGSVELGDLTIV